MIESFLKDLLVTENFIEGILQLNLTRDPTEKEGQEGEEEKGLEIDNDSFIKFALTKSNISDYGLRFFFDVMKDLVISKEVVEVFYQAIIKIARTKMLPIEPVPEMPGPDAEGNEPSEEVKEQA